LRGIKLVRIIVDVKTEASEEGIEKTEEGRYTVRVKKPRRKGRANVAVLKIIRKHFGRRAYIISGHRKSRKIVGLCEEK
jgi:uncharacterized protein (TIGR00251 family)